MTMTTKQYADKTKKESKRNKFKKSKYNVFKKKAVDPDAPVKEKTDRL
jgi:hypothetical protein